MGSECDHEGSSLLGSPILHTKTGAQHVSAVRWSTGQSRHHNHEEGRQSFGSLFMTMSIYVANIKLISIDTTFDLSQPSNIVYLHSKRGVSMIYKAVQQSSGSSSNYIANGV